MLFKCCEFLERYSIKYKKFVTILGKPLLRDVISFCLWYCRNYPFSRDIQLMYA